MITRPTIDQLNFNPNEADVEILDSGKQALGFVYKEKLGSKVMNFLNKRLSVWTNWLIQRIDAHETVENITFDLTSVDIEDIQEFFSNLRHNDFNITLTGDYDLNTTIISITDISGIGSIIFSGNITVGGVLISNVNNNVRFNAELNVEQTTQYGLRIVNSPYVYVNELNCTFESAPSSDWCLVRLENGKLTCLTPDFDGRFTSASTPTYLIRIDSKSQILLGTDYNVKTNAIAGSVIGHSMIQVDKGGLFDTSAVPIFSNWAQNYSFQIEMINYPKTEYPIDFNIDTGIAHVKRVLANMESVNCHLQSIGINDDVQDLIIENIDGTGNIDIRSITCTSGCIVSNCNCTITLDDIEVQDQTSHGSYGLKIVDCANVVLGTQTVIDAGTNAYEALLIDNSKVWVEDLRYINEPATPATNYVDITNNSNVYFKRILSGYASMVVPDSIFISIYSGSKVSVNSWVPAHVDTTSLKFKSINNGGFAIGFTSANKYILATTPADITIVQLP